MNMLAKLMIILLIPMFAMCSNAQTRTYSQAESNDSSRTHDFSRAELDQILAPIALYPDTVLSHILIAATYPFEVVQADRWIQANSRLSADAAVDAADNKDWDPSVKALVAFPEILHRMSDDLDWTQRLGDAFLDDEEEVTDVIQDLRQKAYASGNLEKMRYLNVQHDQRVIIIEPAVEREVYIPYYDPRVVYGGWWWPDYPPVYWHSPRNYSYVSGFYWGPRVTLGFGFFSTSFLWHQRQVVYIDRPHYLPHLPRPITSRRIAYYEGAQHWRHDPVHRRGLAYRSERASTQYGNHRAFRERHDYPRQFDNSRTNSRRLDSNSQRGDHDRDWQSNQNHRTVTTRNEVNRGSRDDHHPSDSRASDQSRLRDRIRENSAHEANREWSDRDRAKIERHRTDGSGAQQESSEGFNATNTPAVRGRKFTTPDRGLSEHNSVNNDNRDPSRSTDLRSRLRTGADDHQSISRRVSLQNSQPTTVNRVQRSEQTEPQKEVQTFSRRGLSPRVDSAETRGPNDSERRTEPPREQQPNRDSGTDSSKPRLRERLEHR